MEPIAIYEEERLEGRRTFFLYPDRIVVRCRIAAKDYDHPFDLNDLSPTVRTVRVRPKLLGARLILLILPWPFVLLVTVTRPAAAAEWQQIIPAAASFISLIVAAVSFHKVEFACFSTNAGTPAWDVARRGKDAKNFVAFVSLVAESIRAADAKARIHDDYLA
jgi:hypothetical protein